MNKQEIQFAVATKGGAVVKTGRSQVLQPEVKFRGGIKWLDDIPKEKKGGMMNV